MNGPSNRHPWLSTGLVTRRSRRIMSHAALALAVLLVLSVVVPPDLQAQGRGQITSNPSVPNHPGDTRVSTDGLPTGQVHLMIELDDEPAVVAASRGGGACLSASAAHQGCQARKRPAVRDALIADAA